LWPRIEVRFFVELRDEAASTLQSGVEVVHTEEQQQAVARRGVVGTSQGRVIVVAPGVQAEQDGAVGVAQLAEVVVGRNGLGETEQLPVPQRSCGRRRVRR
jgi:hypothetical protein